MGCFLVTIGYLTPSPNHVQVVFQIKMYLNVATHQQWASVREDPKGNISDLYKEAQLLKVSKLVYV